MSQQNDNQFKLSFIQLIVLLALQVGLLSGAFYFGTKMGTGKVASNNKAQVQDEDLAKLMPSGSSNPSSEAKSPEAANQDNTRTSATPFDKSSSTVFRIKSSSNSEYTIQVASYPDENAAAKVVDEWKKKGYMSFLSVEDIPDRGKWYRVNIGNYGDEASAREFAKKIEEKEHITPQVVLNQ